MKRESRCVKKTAGWLTVLALAVVWSAVGMVFVQANAAEPVISTDRQNIVRFDSEQFTATEDYAAVVPSVSRVTWANRVGNVANPDNDYYQNEYVWQDGIGDVEMRLDAGRTGLLLESKQTGKDAEGTGFAFANTMYGEFSLDFRVFSKESYVGAYGLHNKADAPEYLNTFLDLRIIGFTFTSVSDPTQAFTVYFGGAQLGAATDVVAGVGIAGEGKGMYNSILADVPGYGVSGKNAQRTGLTGTSFSNTAYNEVPGMSSSTKFSFDPVTMRVFAYDRQTLAMGGSRGVRQVENTYLVRDLATNRLGTAADAPVANMAWVKTLSPEDFAAGYTVEATVVEMTANETPGIWGTLLKNTAVATDLEYDDNAYFSNANAKTVREPYERTAKILLYEVNGQSLQVDEGFDVQQITYTGVSNQTKDSTLNTEMYNRATFTGYELTAKAKNAQAEGNVFTVDGEEFKSGGDAATERDYTGQYILGVTAIPTQYAAASITGNKSAYTVECGVPGIGYYDADPYSDVLQYGVTYRSKTDPSKAFTVHVLSYVMSKVGINVSVSVEGEDYVNSYGVAGFAEDSDQHKVRNMAQVAWLAGTSGRGNNFSNESYNNTTKNPYTMIRFDPATMTVYGYGYAWYKLRDLTQQYTAENDGTNKVGTTMTAGDFADGFTVEVGIERMNTEWNRGRTTVYRVDQGRQMSEMSYTKAPFTEKDYVFEEGYDRQAKIRIISTATGHVDIAEDSLTYSSTTTHKGDSTRLYIGNAKYTVRTENDAVALTDGGLYSVAGTQQALTEVSYRNEDGSDTGTVTYADGNGTFYPKKVGIYTFTTGKYEQTVRVADGTPPAITLPDTSVSVDNNAVESATKPTGTATDTVDGAVAVTDDWDTVLTQGMKAGNYTVTYTATDAAGNTGTATLTVTVVDKIAPVITLTGGNTVTVDSNAVTTATAPAATAVDETDETVTVTNDWADVIPQVTATGNYTVTYTATDAAGNTATATLTVTVTDTTPPVITLPDGPVSVDNNAVESATKPTVTATDAIDGTVAVTDDWDAVLTQGMRAGDYTVTYTATDTAGNIGTATLTVTVVDKIAPVITLTGGNTVTVGSNAVTTATAPAATAVDETDETVTVTNDWADVIPQVTATGNYTVTYTATDAAGNTATATLTVTVTDTTPPVITIAGGNTVAIGLGAVTTATAPTATAVDETDETVTVTNDWADVIPQVTATGDYTVTYTATDAAGNTATATLTVHVDGTAPTIVLLGSNPLHIAYGTTVADPGAAATDDTDDSETVTAAITSDWAITATTAVGTYTVTYTVSDTAGNQATVTRTVIVEKAEVTVTVKSSGAADITLTLAYGDTLSVTMLVRDGFTLEGLFTDEAMENAYTADAVTADVTLYAKWTEASAPQQPKKGCGCGSVFGTASSAIGAAVLLFGAAVAATRKRKK